MEYDLKNYGTDTLAKIWNKLNCWEWPDELDGKPTEWDTLPEHIPCDYKSLTKYNISDPIINKIKNMIGEKECLRWHHIHNLNSTNEEFEQWYKDECWRFV